MKTLLNEVNFNSNNNPFNLREAIDPKTKKPIAWKGRIGANKGFVKFKRNEDGFRAGALNAIGHINRGSNTIEKLINKLSPPNENDTNGYINFISRRANLNESNQIENTHLPYIFQGIVQMETSRIIDLETVKSLIIKHNLEV